MNKKGTIALIVVVVLIVVGYMAFGRSNSSVDNQAAPAAGGAAAPTPVPAGISKDSFKPVTSDTTDSSLLGRLKNVSVSVTEDGKKIGLLNGMATFTVSGSSDKGSVALGSIAVSKIKGSRNDVLTTLSVTASGSTSVYLALFQDNGGSALDDKSYALIGSNVTVTGVRTDDVADSNVDYVVSVSYKDASGAAHSKIFVVAAGLFDDSRTISL